MKTIVISCVLIVFQMTGVNAQILNKSFFEKKVGYDILIDQCDRSGLEGPEFGKYLKKYYASYKSDDKTIEELSKHIQGINIKIVLGTWCHDSKIQVPVFIKILDQISFKDEKLELICVDRLKKTHDYSIKDMKIKRVPTFIFYKNGEEIGRIIESPKETLEKDFLKIVN